LGLISSIIFSIGIIRIFVVFFIAVNILTFILYVVDKQKSLKNKERISEKTLIFFTLACGGIGALLGMCIARHKTKKIKFKIAVVIGLIIAIIPIIHIVHGLTVDREIAYVEVEFHSENWSYELDGYRIAFMTDFHVTPHEDMRDVVAELNERNIDLLLLGGDFSTHGLHYRGTVREIAQTNVTDGIFGVDGNHDYYRWLFSAFEQYGVIPLDNNGFQIREGFYLAGVQDMWRRNPNVQEATQNANAEDFILLVTHNPDVAMTQSTSHLDLILAGHTHGGQITLFGFPMYLLRNHITRYGTRFAHGFAYSADGVPVFTSRGVGVYYSIPRIFARPEVIIFTMRNV